MGSALLENLVGDVKSNSNAVFAVHHQKFFKTGPGEYGEGDKFFGLKVPQLRDIAKKYTASGKKIGATLQDINALLDSPWHELRFIGLLFLCSYAENSAFSASACELNWQDALKSGLTLAHDNDTNAVAASRRYREAAAFYSQPNCNKGCVKSGQELYAACASLYLCNVHRINNWDLVDLSASKVLGPIILNDSGDLLHALSRSGHLWTERISVLSTHYAIKKGDYSQFIELAEFFLPHKHDLMHKATGWMLREAGKKDLAVLKGFLDKFYTKMPRTMLRYAIEHLPEVERKHYMGK